MLVIVGCGQDGKVRIEGTVKLPGGKPVVQARVIAQDVGTGKWASGVTDENGHFTLGTEKADEGLPPGEYAISIVENQKDWDHPTPPQISPKYGNPATSGLKLTVDGGENKPLEFELAPP